MSPEENPNEGQEQMNLEAEQSTEGSEEKPETGRPSYKTMYNEQMEANKQIAERLAELEKADKEAKQKRMEDEGDFKGIIEDLNAQILGTTEKLTEAQQMAKAENLKADFFRAAYEGGVRTDALEDAFKLASIEEGSDMNDVVATLLDTKSFLKADTSKTAPRLDTGNQKVTKAKESYQEKRDRIYGSQGDGVWENPEQYGGGVVEIHGQ